MKTEHYTDDGTILASGSEDGTVLLWELGQLPTVPKQK